MRSHEVSAEFIAEKFRINEVIWRGLHSKLTFLEDCGWDFTYRPAYQNWRVGGKSHDYLYLRHPESKMIARITVPDYMLDDGCVVLDYMTLERNRRVKPNPVFDTEALTVDDVPALLDMILKLQSEYPKMPEQVQPTVMAMIA